jgi:molybdenum cofactor sulfurtransferase
MGQPWDVMAHGLRYDREWMIVEPGTGMALSQKVHTLMALIRPVIDLVHRRLRVSIIRRHSDNGDDTSFDVSLDEEIVNGKEDGDAVFSVSTTGPTRRARVCSESVEPLLYPSSHPSSRILADFLGIPCVLARLPAGASTRHAHFAAPGTGTDMVRRSVPVPILLSNESPFLLINGSSVDAVRSWVEPIYSDDGHGNRESSTLDDQVVVDPASFRANLAVRPSLLSSPLPAFASPCHMSRYPSGAVIPIETPPAPQPFVEDTWDLVVSMHPDLDKKDPQSAV